LPISRLLKGGGLRWSEHDATEEELQKGLKVAAEADPEASLVVQADREVIHVRVVHVLDLAKLAGITKFAINVQAE